MTARRSLRSECMFLRVSAFRMHARIVEALWVIFPCLQPQSHIARRFRGKVAWNGLVITKHDTLHSISFKVNHWIDLIGFEMLTGDFSFKLTYTVTRGLGVMGNVASKGTGYVGRGDILSPTKIIRLQNTRRIEPDTWYTINVLVNIHEYEMQLISSCGSEGHSVVYTDNGIVVHYAAGQESSSRTNLSSGQIPGIVYTRLHPEDEKFYDENKGRRRVSYPRIGAEDLPSPLKPKASVMTDPPMEPTVLEKRDRSVPPPIRPKDPIQNYASQPVRSTPEPRPANTNEPVAANVSDQGRNQFLPAQQASARIPNSSNAIGTVVRPDAYKSVASLPSSQTDMLMAQQGSIGPAQRQEPRPASAVRGGDVGLHDPFRSMNSIPGARTESPVLQGPLSPTRGGPPALRPPFSPSGVMRPPLIASRRDNVTPVINTGNFLKPYSYSNTRDSS
jgi:hypothetical protein